MTGKIRPLVSAACLFMLGLAGPGLAATTTCTSRLTDAIPRRASVAPAGSATLRDLRNLGGTDRDHAIEKQLMAGNVPSFLRELVPVTFSGKGSDGNPVVVTICVMPDYLAVGDNADFVRTPLGLPAAAAVAVRFGFLLPTTRMVDAIYAQAKVHLPPRPMQAGPRMVSTDYLLRHNDTVDAQLGREAGQADELVAGQKKDLVLSNRLRRAPGKVAIYGWHRTNGQPIQPLSTVHQETYADYSHGIRLVSTTAFVNGRPVALAGLLQDPAYAPLLSKEGPIRAPGRLLASYAN